jgi:opacity protein-like surface antigen
MKKFALTCILSCAACAFTFAGPERVESKETVVPQPLCGEFGGFNIGASFGGVMHNWTWNDNDSWVDNFAFDFNTSNPSKSGTGVTAGASFGYDWQRGCALIGFVVDGNWASVDETIHASPFGGPGTELTLTGDLNWWGTVRTRTGVVVDNLLLYVTGGVAFADIDHHWAIFDSVITPPSINAESFSAESLRWGGVAGVGAEWALNRHWSFRSEFLYIYFVEDNTSGASLAGGSGPPANTPDIVHFDTQDSMVVGRFALVYRFCGGN